MSVLLLPIVYGITVSEKTAIKLKKNILFSPRKVEEYNYQKIVFDKKLLKEVSFNTIYEYNCTSSEHSNINDFSQVYLPYMDKENGMMIGLHVRVIK
ncbi:hypothetical protein N9A28_08750 [Sulfurimonas sp.]|nr:hypothetical protein [Sulfurimonas sp.]